MSMSDPQAVTADTLRAFPLPDPEESGGKDERGRVLVIGGSREVPGAVLLGATAALRAGAGKLQVATVVTAAPHLALALPEARVIGLAETAEGEIDPSSAPAVEKHAARVDAVLIGPGMLDDGGARRFVLDLLGGMSRCPFVLDAAAITGLRDDGAALREHGGRLVMTPHAGEIATFLGLTREAVLAEPLSAGRRACEKIGGVVIMKGACTFICSPCGTAWSCRQGNVGLATSGSGDTLAGIIAGLLARGAAPAQAAQWGVFIHGEAGNRLAERIGPIGYLAREILGEIPTVMNRLNGGSGA